MKARKGVYILFNKNKAVYVGQSKDMAHRIGEHIRGVNGSIKIFDSFDFIEIPDYETRVRVESLLIKLLKPVYNKTPGPEYRFISEETEEEIEKFRNMTLFLNVRRLNEQIISDWEIS